MNKLFVSLGLVLSLFFASTLMAQSHCVDVVDTENAITFREVSDAPWTNEVKGSVKTQSGFIKGQPRPGIKVLQEMYYRVDEPAQVKSKEWKLLIHGLGDHSGHMNALTEKYLNDGFRVVRVDLMGLGRTLWNALKNDANVDETVDIRSNALSILEILNQLKVKKVEIVGHSLGGAVSLLTGAYGINMLNKKQEIKITSIRLMAFYAQDLGEWMISQALTGAQLSDAIAKGVQFFAPKSISESVTQQTSKNNSYLNQFFAASESIFRYIGLTTFKYSITDPKTEKYLYNGYSTYIKENAKAEGLDDSSPGFEKLVNQLTLSSLSVQRGAREGFNLFRYNQELPRTDIPIQIIAFGDDKVVQLSLMEQAAIHLEKLGYKVDSKIIDGVGHLAPRENPDQVYNILKKRL